MPKPKMDPDENYDGWCSNCLLECRSHYEDFGFSYGDRGYQEDWRLVSNCCSVEVLEANPIPEDDEDATERSDAQDSINLLGGS